MPNYDADVVIYDSVAPTHPSTWDETKPLGGSEKGLLVLKRALEADGVKVELLGLPARGMPQFRRARALIVNRTTPDPAYGYGGCIAADRKVRLLQDKEPWPSDMQRVFVSAWQRRAHGCVDGSGAVIYPHIDQAVVDLAALELPKIPGQWIYASSYNKGLNATLEAWHARPETMDDAVLTVVNTYQGASMAQRCREDRDVTFLDPCTPYQLARHIAQSEGMFFYNTYEECFPMTVAIAKMMKCKAILGCVGHEMCGVREAAQVTLDNERSTSQWMGVLGL